LTRPRDFDVAVVYYGNGADHFRDQSDFYLRRQGSKFQNLHYCYKLWPELFARYEAVMLMDDDVLIQTENLSRLFQVRRRFDLWLLQPAFRIKGKISWDITRVRPTSRLRYTNFVEMTCPLFLREKLDEFMAVYDPKLTGYGVDHWYLKVIGGGDERRLAIVDEISCINPHDRYKGGVREIDRLQSTKLRIEAWNLVRMRNGWSSERANHREYGGVRNSAGASAAGLLKYSADWMYVRGRSQAGRIIRGSRSLLSQISSNAALDEHDREA
jgi:hypothetical protein